MPMHLQCPNPACARASIVPDEFDGRAVRCRHCRRAFVAQQTGDATASRDTPPAPGGPADPFPTLPAQFGRYQVLRLLGRGGMGAVYLATDSHLGRRVALKLPSLQPGDSPQRAERFVREARSAAVLQHPNICTVYDAGQIDGRPYISMAFIDGKPLDEQIDPARPMPQAAAARLARQVALALREAHDQGIVHRDLKPGNVMLTPRGEPVVMDFGLAKRLDEEEEAPPAARPGGATPGASTVPGGGGTKLTRDGAVLGTPAYMAPEQARGELARIGPHTDVYALGVILFEMLTGRVPYRGSPAMVMGQIMAAPVPPVGEFRPDADPALEEVCRRAMAKEPADRFESMAAFAAALDEYLLQTTAEPFAGLTDSARPAANASVTRSLAPGSAPARERPRRRWPLAVGAGLAALLAAVAAVLLTVRTPYGEVVVELSDPSARVDIAVDGDAIDLTAAGKGYRLKAGEHGLTVSGAGFETVSTTFAVKDGGREVVRVTLRPVAKPAQPVPGTPGTPTGPARPAGPATPASPDPPPVAVVDAAGNLTRAAIPAETLAYLRPDNPARLPAELVGVFGSVTGRLPEESCWPDFTPDGRFLVVPSNKELRFVEWPSGRLDRVVRVPRSPGNLHHVRISPDGKLAACGSHFSFGVTFVDVQTGATRAVLVGRLPAQSQPFLPDGRGAFVVDADTDELTCVSTADGSVIGRLPVTVPKGTQGWRVACHPAPDGKDMLVVGGRTITVVSAADLKPRPTPGITGDSIYKSPEPADAGVPARPPDHIVRAVYRSVRFSPDGRRLLVATEPRWEVFEWPSLKLLGAADTPAAFATFDPTGDRVWAATHGLGNEPAAIRCFEVATGKEVRKATLTGRTAWVFWASPPDRRSIAAFAGHEKQLLCRIDGATGAVTTPAEFGHARELHAVAVSPDGVTAVTAGEDMTVRLWDLATGAERACLRRHEAAVRWVGFSRDGRLFASADSSGRLALWDRGGSFRAEVAAGKEFQVPAFTPDGKWLVAGLPDGRLGFHSTATGALERSTPKVAESPWASLAFSPDGGSLAVSGAEAGVRVVDPATGAVRKVLAAPAGLRALAFSPDGRHLYAADPVVRRWAVETGAVTTLPQPGQATGVAVQPGGTLVATSGVHAFIRVADAADPGRTPVTFYGGFRETVTRVAFTPDGKHLLAVGSSGLVCVYRLPNTPGETAAWFDRMNDEAALPRRRVTYQPDQLRAGAIKAPDLSGAKTLFGCEFDAPTKDFPSAGPGKFPRAEGGAYRVDNAAGEVVQRWAEGEARRTRVALPGAYADFAAEVVARATGQRTTWYLLIEDGDEQYEVRVGKTAVAVGRWRYENGGQILVGAPLPAGATAAEFRRLLVVVRGARLDVYLDGAAVFDPVHLPAPVRDARLSVKLVGLGSARLDIDRVRVCPAPPAGP